MRLLKPTIFVALLGTLAVLAASCILPLTSPSAAQAKGTLVLQIEGLNSARTLAPNLGSIINHVTAEFTPTEGNTVTANFTRDQGNVPFSVTLAPGTDWIGTFEAFDDAEALLARASLEVKGSELGETVLEKPVILVPSTSGTGSFDVAFQFATGATTFELTFTRYPDTTPTSANVYAGLLAASSATTLVDQKDLTSGTYTLDPATGKARVQGSLTSGNYVISLKVDSVVFSSLLAVYDNLSSTGTVSNPVRHVYFNGGVGTGSIAELAIPYLASAVLPANTFSRPGWSGEWTDSSTLVGGNTFTGGDQFQMTSSTDVTLYADWQATITFDPGNGTGPQSSQIIGDGDTVPLTTMSGLSRVGYNFLRWNTASDGTGTPFEDGASFTPGSEGSLTLYAQWTLVYTFTNAGATGRYGPTQSQVTSAYSSTPLAGEVTSTTNNGTPGIQKWVVPTTGTYRIEGYGAQGAVFDATYGRGALMMGDFALTQGDTLWILVGQEGSANGLESYGHGGGGGGTFVAIGSGTLSTTTPLLAAGGGGAAGDYGGDQSASNGSVATAGNSGQNNPLMVQSVGPPIVYYPYNAANNAGGTSGGAGATGGLGFDDNSASGLDAASGWSGSGSSSQSFLSGGAGTLSYGSGANGDGGFGGGGGLTVSPFYSSAAGGGGVFRRWWV